MPSFYPTPRPQCKPAFCLALRAFATADEKYSSICNKSSTRPLTQINAYAIIYS
jgi:hypothetical protein